MAMGRNHDPRRPAPKPGRRPCADLDWNASLMTSGQGTLWRRYALVTPLCVTTILTVLISLALILALSFQTVDVVKLFTSLTTDAYVENLGRPLFWRLLWRSI